MPETVKDGEWVEGQLQITEGKCPPVSRKRYDGAEAGRRRAEDDAMRVM